jgi:hypothetical protein
MGIVMFLTCNSNCQSGNSPYVTETLMDVYDLSA